MGIFGSICILAMLLSVCNVNAADSVNKDPDKLYDVTLRYKAKHTEAPKTKFQYKDTMLLEYMGKDEMSTDLALASADLAMAAYRDNYIEDALIQMGYETLTTSKYYSTERTYEDNDHVAYKIANKEVEFEGEVYDIYIIPIRGTSGNCEWYSNFNVGTGRNHEGFYNAAQEILDKLTEVGNDDYDIYHTIVWTMGHSRGAAVANIIAGTLSKEQMFADHDNVFGYTYACPNVSYDADTSR